MEEISVDNASDWYLPLCLGRAYGFELRKYSNELVMVQPRGVVKMNCQLTISSTNASCLGDVSMKAGYDSEVFWRRDNC